MLPADLAAAILADCDSATLASTLERIEMTSIAPALQKIPPDNLADIALRLSESTRTNLLSLLETTLSEEVRRLLAFEPDTAGGLMTPRYLSVPDVVTVSRALELLRASKGAESHSYIYVVDAYGRLSGVVPLRTLILANPRHLIKAIMRSPVVSVASSARAESMITLFNEHHYVSLPVIDDKGRIVGIVTSDVVLEAMRQSGDRLLQEVVGAGPREVLQETAVAARARIPWVTATAAGGLACALIAGAFRDLLIEMVVLGIFMPVVLALAESVAAQTISVVLSGHARGTLSGRDQWRLAGKELAVGLWVGLYAGALVGLLSLLFHGDWRLGALLGGAILVSTAWATALAVAIPTLIKRLRADSALASGPLVLTLADLSTLVVYLGGAALFRSLWH